MLEKCIGSKCKLIRYTLLTEHIYIDKRVSGLSAYSNNTGNVLFIIRF